LSAKQHRFDVGYSSFISHLVSYIHEGIQITREYYTNNAYRKNRRKRYLAFKVFFCIKDLIMSTARTGTISTKAITAFKGLGFVCLHMMLETKHWYTRSICSLNSVMKAKGIGRKKQRRKKHVSRLYDTPKTAGERVQIDVKYVPKECLVEGMPKLYQYTAIDEAARIRCRVIFDEHSNWNSMRFLHYVRKKFPFEIKCVQTDNGTEFTNALLNPGKQTEFEQYLKKENLTINGYDLQNRDTTERLSGYNEWTVKDFIRIERFGRRCKQGRKSPLRYFRDNFTKSVTDHLTT